MKVVVIGTHLCADTTYALCKLKERKAEVVFKNISASIADLKEYLAVRESSPLYDEVKKEGILGVPYFELEDGTKTLDLDVVLEKLNA